MCTLTYVPAEAGFVATINRDETPLRSAAMPVIEEYNQRQLWLAPEPVSGSSNSIFDIVNHRLMVLLNGAFMPHDHRPPYRLSRGVVIKESFSFPNLAEMSEGFDFSEIEPFTLIKLDRQGIEELRWDGGRVLYSEPVTDTATIWSSAKLYSQEIIKQREEQFAQWIGKTNAIYPQNLFEIHQRKSPDSRGPGFRMNHADLVKTVSITQFLFEPERVRLRYLDLENQRDLIERVF